MKYFALLTIVMIFLAGCAQTSQPSSQLANPASQKCLDVGGELDIVDTADGQIGMCTLPDGRECEEWALFRGECEEVKACTREYMPVCGIDNVTYSNNCTAGNIKIQYSGECIVDFDSCEASGKPIMESYPRKCSFNGQTYTEVISHTCTDEEKSAEICTMEYLPVCGSDNKTYGNGCSACSSNITSWTYGEC